MITEKFINEIKQWGTKNTNIKSIIIVGSYARGTNKATSDIDLIIITTNKDEMLNNQNFTELFGEVERTQTEYYGACTSVRVWYKNGPEVEFGLVTPDWIAQPLDKGTYIVLSDGYNIIIDKNKYFNDINL